MPTKTKKVEYIKIDTYLWNDKSHFLSDGLSRQPGTAQVARISKTKVKYSRSYASKYCFWQNTLLFILYKTLFQCKNYNYYKYIDPLCNINLIRNHTSSRPTYLIRPASRRYVIWSRDASPPKCYRLRTLITQI